MFQKLFLTFSFVFLVSCQTPSKEALTSEAMSPTDISFQIEFLGDQILPRDFSNSKYDFGGISGLDWRSGKKDMILAVSDDRGRNGPSRYYELKIEGADSVSPRLSFVKEVVIKDKNGKAYPKRSFDTEGIASGRGSDVYVSSEGDFVATKSAVPGILKLDKNGKTKGFHKIGPPVFPKDENWKENTYGIRENSSLESLDFNPQKQTLVTVTENSLVQDGPVADQDRGANTRIFVYDVSKKFPGKLLKQNVYPISKVPSQNVEGKSKMGVTDVFIDEADKYYVIERAYLSGRSKNRVQLFYADCTKATDVKKMDSLKEQKFELCKKDLIYDFDVLIGKLGKEHPRVDNLEGIALGPKDKKTGARTMLLISDNNFSSGTQKTQVLFFRVSRKR